MTKGACVFLKKKSIRLVLLSVLMLNVGLLFGQNTPTRKCGTDIPWNEFSRNPALEARFRAHQQMIQQKVNQILSSADSNTTVVYKIPVVFHIVLPDPTVVTNAQIQQQIAVLNRDYSGLNADSTNAPLFYSVRGHSKIQFELAKRSPEGCDTNGITRTVSALNITLPSANLIKSALTNGKDAWESYNTKYLNVWVGNFTDGYLGVATFPWENIPDQMQGVVLNVGTFSFNAANAPFHLGKTLTHEVGHYLGMYHIWGDQMGCATDDGVSDTPIQDVQTGGAPVGAKFDVCSPAATVKGINYQNFMDYSDDAVMTMFTKIQMATASANLATYANRTKLWSSSNKALTPKEPNILFNTCNTPAFATNAFNTIGVGKDGAVWAGTSNLGLYKYSDSQWVKYGSYSNNLYLDIKADKTGGIWIAQGGYNGAQSITGGILHFPDSSFPATPNFYSLSSGLPSRYPRSLYVDTTRFYTGSSPKIWSANFAQITAGTSANGGIGVGFSPTAPNFSTKRNGLDPASISGGTASCVVLGGNATEIWTFVTNNFNRSQLLVYNAAVDTFLRAIDTTNELNGKVSGNFTARSIYFDVRGNKWVGVNGSGILVKGADNSWNKMSDAAIYPAGTLFNTNAIVGDTSGNVYIGTSNGLIVYRNGKALDIPSSYKRYTTVEGLPSNNIRGLAVDTLRKRILVATDNGIVFWNPTCADGPPAVNTFTTIAAGDWNNPAIWCNGVVPPNNQNVIVKHNITVTADATCNSLTILNPAVVTVNAGINLNILH